MYEIVSTGEPEKCEIVEPVVVSTAVRSYAADAALIPSGETSVVATDTTVEFETSPGANATVALPSPATAEPPPFGVTSPGGDGPLPGVAAGSGGGGVVPSGSVPAGVLASFASSPPAAVEPDVVGAPPEPPDPDDN